MQSGGWLTTSATDYSEEHVDPAENIPLAGIVFVESEVAAEVATAGNHAGNCGIAPMGIG